MLITGVQRSGTHYSWEMMNRLGVHVHHEGLGPDGAVSWFFAYRSDAGYAINNPERLSDQRFRVVLHQVRHPLRVVSSVVKASRKPWDKFWEWIARTEPRVCFGQAPVDTTDPMACRRIPLLLRASRLWLYWNEHIERFADVRYERATRTPDPTHLPIAFYRPRRHNTPPLSQVPGGGYITAGRVPAGAVPGANLWQPRAVPHHELARHPAHR